MSLEIAIRLDSNSVCSKRQVITARACVHKAALKQVWLNCVKSLHHLRESLGVHNCAHRGSQWMNAKR